MYTKKALPILFLVMFLVMVGFGIIIPIIPFYAEELGASPTELGFLMAIYSVMQLIFAPIWGKISDRIGRKPVILIGTLGLALSFFLMAFSTQLWMLFAARTIGGILSSANMPTIMAYAADITTENDRGKAMGVIGAATGLGFIFGPAIGGVFSANSLTTPFYVAGFASLFTVFIVLFTLKESLKKTLKKSPATKQKMFQALRGPASIMYFITFFVTLSLAGLEATFAYFAAETAGLGTKELGYIFMIMGLGSAVVQGGLVGMLINKLGEAIVIHLGIIISAIGFALILLVDNFLTAAIYLTIFGIGNGIIRPSVTTLLTKRSKHQHGEVTGLISSFDSLGRIIGPPLGGFLFSIAIGLPYVAGILISLIALTLFRFFMITQQRNFQRGF